MNHIEGTCPNSFFKVKGSLDTFAKLSGFEMSLYGLKRRIEKIERYPENSSTVQTLWIEVHNVPDMAREVETIKEIVTLVPKPLVVDDLSLVRAGLVRVQGRCTNPVAVRGTIEFFFQWNRLLTEV